MASTMLTGDRRWTPTRKLTVLGKVPKPINLPSQRLENHGVDPNVEIVPKGTLTWGSRPSTSTAVPNAWGTSSCSSPHTDGTSGSPSHRPSSGGGSRPSTAGSARSHEHVSNAWGPNSRPSSASGVLTSSQISAAATRPRSADTRPGSSQLTRFADNLIDITAASVTAGAAEKLGTASSKSSAFTLSSGDFPSLGSDKNSDTHSQRGHSSQGRPQSSQGRPQSSQGRPHSACGADSRPNEFLEHHVNRNTDHFEHGTVNTWKADYPQHAGHGTSPNIDNLHRDPHHAPSYPHMNMPPPHYDSGHNPPFRPANGAWYRGGAPGGPYSPPGPPGSYPIDYPHVQARSLSNHHPFPRQDAVHGQFYPNNCEPCRPYMPTERYMGPSHNDVPVRPGAYPGPVPYEGYYGPHRPDFHDSSERDTSIMGMARPVIHNQYATQHQSSDSANFHARSGGYARVMNKEKMEPHQANETQGPYRVLLKQHESSEGHTETDTMEHSLVAGTPHLEKGKHAGVLSHNGEEGKNSQTQQTVVSPTLTGHAVSSRPTGGVDANSIDTVVRTSLMDSPNVVDDGLMMRSEAANFRSRGLQQYPMIKKNASLMEKVEVLNNKARIADVHGIGGPNSSREKPIGLKDVTAGAVRYTKVASSNDSSVDTATYMHNMGTTMPKESNALAENKNQEATTDGKVISFTLNSFGAGENAHFLGQEKVHVAENVDYHAKSRSNRRDKDEGMKELTGSESSTNTTMTSAADITVETDASHAAPEKQEVLHAASGRDASQTISSVDPVYQKAQRVKMREIRAKQLQQEEEERTREQIAKALAKLEELNMRTLAESSNLKSPLPSSDVLNNKTESGPNAIPTDNIASLEASGATLACNSNAMKQVDDCGIKNLGHSTVLSLTGADQVSHSATQSSEVPQAQSLFMEQESSSTTKIMPETTLDIHHNPVGKQKQVGYGKKISPQESSTGGKQKNSSNTRSPTDKNEIVVNAPRSDTLSKDPPVQHKKRNNRSTRHNNANNLAEGLTNSTSPSQLHTAVSSENHPTASGKIDPSTSMERAVLVPSESSHENVETMSSREVHDMHVKRGLLESAEDDHGRGSNHWKPHTQRKTTRNQQPNKLGSKYHANDAVMWAPVKITCKNETADDVSKNSVTEPTKPNGKSGNDMHNGLKAKRAEIERYVPKPVAKELSQQVNSQQASPSLGQSASGDTTDTGLPSTGSSRRDGPPAGKAAAASDTINGEIPKHNKNGRANASWRQRGSAESPPVGGCVSSDNDKIVQTESDKIQTSNIVYLPEGKVTHTDDGWNDNSNTVPPGESVATTVVGKSYGTSRQRRQPYEVHRVTGSNHPATESMGSHQGITDRTEHPSPALGHNESEGRNTARNGSQSAAVESAKPHWQPKSQAYSHGRQGYWDNRGAQIAVSLGLEIAPAMNDDTVTSGLRTTAVEASDARHQQSRRERTVTADSVKEQTTGKLTPPDDGHQCDQTVPMGGNQRGKHYGRFQRGYAPSYRGRDFGQETNMRNYGGKGSRGSQHVEYQRIGSHDETRERFQQNPNTDEGTHESSRAPGSWYRERGGRRFPRGGGGGQFYGQSSGAAARVVDSYNGGE